MESWPKRARTSKWQNGVLTLDSETQIDVPQLTPEMIARLASYNLVGFFVKGCPVTDAMLEPFLSARNMVNFGVEDGALTDASFRIFASMPKLRYLLLEGNAEIIGSRLSDLQGCKLDLLTLSRTSLDDAGLLQAASIPNLTHVHIDHTAVTLDGLLAIAGNSRIEPVSHEQFTKEQMKSFFQLQREKTKSGVAVDQRAAEECRGVLTAFFGEMTEWEQYMGQAGFDDPEGTPRLQKIWDKYVSEKPRMGYRPLALTNSTPGTYTRDEFVDVDQLTRSKLYIYTEQRETGFQRRFLMKKTRGCWKIDAVYERLDGWERSGL